MSGASPLIGGPGLAQVRRIVGEAPGPRSRELRARQRRLVPAGAGATVPVFVEVAGGGVTVEVDGNSFIDFGSGIAVTTVGNSARSVAQQAAAQLHRFTHTCFLANPYESYLGVCEKLNELTPVPGEKRTILANSGAEAWRTPSRSHMSPPAVPASSSSTTPSTDAHCSP